VELELVVEDVVDVVELVVDVVELVVVELVVELVDPVELVVGGVSQPSTQNTLCFVSAPCKFSALTVSLTWKPC